jgi:hypothetical protein
MVLRTNIVPNVAESTQTDPLSATITLNPDLAPTEVQSADRAGRNQEPPAARFDQVVYRNVRELIFLLVLRDCRGTLTSTGPVRRLSIRWTQPTERKHFWRVKQTYYSTGA